MYSVQRASPKKPEPSVVTTFAAIRSCTAHTVTAQLTWYLYRGGCKPVHLVSEKSPPPVKIATHCSSLISSYVHLLRQLR